MTPRSTKELIDGLCDRSRQNIAILDYLTNRSDEELNRRPREGAWSALEAVEHIRRYADVYHPEFAAALERHVGSGPRPTFTSGWLGNKLAAGMKPGPKMPKVKTFASKNPLGSSLDRGVLQQFRQQQEELLKLLNAARGVDLTGVRVATTLPLLKMRFGDALRTVVYHNWRHLEQAERAVQGE